MPAIEHITSDDHFTRVLTTTEDEDTSVLVDFTAAWSGPCQQMKPFLDKIAAQDGTGKIRYYRLDVDQVPEARSECRVRSMPTFIVFKNGRQMRRVMGSDQPRLQALVDALRK